MRNPVCPENLEQILAWIEHQAEINIAGANIRNFSSLSGKFCASQMASQFCTLSVSNFQNYNQRIEVLSNPTGRRAERAPLAVTETVEQLSKIVR
jgi:hypothetical protein